MPAPAELTADRLRAVADAFTTQPRPQPTDEDRLLEKRWRDRQSEYHARLLEAMVASGQFELASPDAAHLAKSPVVGVPEPDLSPEEKEAEKEAEKELEQEQAEEADDAEAQRQHRLAQRQEHRDEAAFRREVRQNQRDAALAEIRDDPEAVKAALVSLFAEAGIDLAKIAATNRTTRVQRLVAAVDEARGVFGELQKADDGGPPAKATDQSLRFRLRSCVAEINELAAELGVAGADGQFGTGHGAVEGDVDLGTARLGQPARLNLQGAR